MDEQFIKESYKSYQKCHVANSARRNSLMKKTIGFEKQRKLTSNQLDKEERLLREHLKSMKIEQTKNSICSGVRGGGATSSRKSKRSTTPPADAFVEPYPVTFGGHIPTMFRPRSHTTNRSEEAMMKLAARRGRRVSNEFEDLSINTSTGQLAIPSHLLRHKLKLSPMSSGSLSPSSPRRGLSGSVSSLDSADNSHWQGDPLAIQSVRRPRKSVTQQDRERLMRKRSTEVPYLPKE